MCRTLIILMLLHSAAASGQVITGYEGNNTRVSTTDVASHHTKYLAVESYLERWRIGVARKGGGWMEFSYVLTNIGPGSERAAVDISRYDHAVGKPNTPKNYYRWHKKYKKGDWTANSKKLDLKIKDSWLKQTPKGLQGRIAAWKYELEFTVTRKSPAFKAGNGRLK